MALGDIDVPPNPVAIAPIKENEVFVVYKDRSCTLWNSDPETPKIVEEYAGIRGPVNSVAAFERNTVISGSTDGTCRVWELGARDMFQVRSDSLDNFYINFSLRFTPPWMKNPFVWCL